MKARREHRVLAGRSPDRAGAQLGRLLEAGLSAASRPVRQVGLVLAQLRLRHGGQQSGPGVGAAGVGRRRAVDERDRGLDAGRLAIGEGVTGLAGWHKAFGQLRWPAGGERWGVTTVFDRVFVFEEDSSQPLHEVAAIAGEIRLTVTGEAR